MRLARSSWSPALQVANAQTTGCKPQGPGNSPGPAILAIGQEQFRVYELRSICLVISPLLSPLFSLGQFCPHLLGNGIVCVHHHKIGLKLSERRNCLVRVIYETFSICVLI